MMSWRKVREQTDRKRTICVTMTKVTVSQSAGRNEKRFFSEMMSFLLH